MEKKNRIFLMLILMVLCFSACGREIEMTGVQVDTALQERVGEGTLRRTRKNADTDVDKDAVSNTNQNTDLDTEDEIGNTEAEQSNDEETDTIKESGQQGEIAKYKALVKNEVPFYNEEEDKNVYLSEYKLTGYAADYDQKS